MSNDDELATAAQKSQLHTLAEQTGEKIPDGLTRAAASERIDELRAKVGLDDQDDPANRPDDEAKPIYGTPIVPGSR